jgi:hypothetical protein
VEPREGREFRSNITLNADGPFVLNDVELVVTEAGARFPSESSSVRETGSAAIEGFGVGVGVDEADDDALLLDAVFPIDPKNLGDGGEFDVGREDCGGGTVGVEA